MLERIILLSIKQRFAVLAAVILLAALGIYNFGRLKIDAVPDITNVQVQVNTSAPGFSPLEAEQRNSGSPTRWRRPSPACRGSNTHVRYRATA